MSTFPGPVAMQGDTVQLTTDTVSLTIAGSIMSRGVLRDGRGFVELTLSDTDPQQRRDLQRATWYQYKLYRARSLLYSSPYLTLSETRRVSNGALALTGSP